MELSVFAILTSLVGGLALFLFGLDQLAGSLKAVAGDRMKALLARLTRNRVVGVLTGAFVTAVIQSSSVTTVLVVGFITAGLMTATQAVGVIMGAHIGTTVTAQILAFRITEYALLLVAVGFGLAFAGRRGIVRKYGTGIMGLGLVFFGMGIMGEAVAPLRSHPAFMRVMASLARPEAGILAGALFTAVVQASAATAGIAIVLAGQGVLSLAGGIAIILGANVGTCVTALLASIGKPREAVRAALLHVLINVTGVLLWLPFLEQLADLVRWISPHAPGLGGATRIAAEAPRQIANAHTVFNVVNTVVFLPFATAFVKAVRLIVPERRAEEEGVVRAKYLDAGLLVTPSLALDRARLELLRMGDAVKKMLLTALPAVLAGSRESLEAVRE